MASKLKVPYYQQTYPSSCGAAILKSIYEYYGISETGDEIWSRVGKPRPGKEENFIWTDDLVDDARQHGFKAHSERANVFDEKSVKVLLKQLKEKEIPAIVVHQLSEAHREIGHFRIITDVRDKYVYLHDPHVGMGGPHMRWTWEKFLDLWKPAGQEVTGGVYVVIRPA